MLQRRKIRRPSSRWILGLVLLTGHQFALPAQAADRWVTHPGAVQADAERAPVALQFRREFTLEQVPARAFVRVAQVSARTGFLITAEDEVLALADTGPQWQVRVSKVR